MVLSTFVVAVSLIAAGSAQVAYYGTSNVRNQGTSRPGYPGPYQPPLTNLPTSGQRPIGPNPPRLPTPGAPVYPNAPNYPPPSVNQPPYIPPYQPPSYPSVGSQNFQSDSDLTPNKETNPEAVLAPENFPQPSSMDVITFPDSVYFPQSETVRGSEYYPEALPGNVPQPGTPVVGANGEPVSPSLPDTEYPLPNFDPALGPNPQPGNPDMEPGYYPDPTLVPEPGYYPQPISTLSPEPVYNPQPGNPPISEPGYNPGPVNTPGSEPGYYPDPANIPTSEPDYYTDPTNTPVADPTYNPSIYQPGPEPSSYPPTEYTPVSDPGRGTPQPGNAPNSEPVYDPQPGNPPSPVPGTDPSSINTPTPEPGYFPQPGNTLVPEPGYSPRPGNSPVPTPTYFPTPTTIPGFPSPSDTSTPAQPEPTPGPGGENTPIPVLPSNDSEWPSYRPSGKYLPNFNCEKGNGFYAVLNSCDSYVECRGNVAYKLSCPDGLHFKSLARSNDYPCAYPTESKCPEGSEKQPPFPSAFCPRQYGFFPMRDGECSKYLMCNIGIATVMDCPHGLVFSEETSSCDWPENVPACNSNAFKDFQCPEGPMFKSGWMSGVIYKYKYGDQCKLYIACQRGHPRLLSCDPGLLFDEYSQTCIAEKSVNCGEYTERRLVRGVIL